MAKMYPERVASGTPMSERTVYEAFARLDDDWQAFHSVAWQGRRHGRQGDGEADFVIAHPNKGIVIVEVKGGAIDIADGRWYSISRNGERHEIRNPFEQAVDSKYALQRFLEERVPGLEKGLRMGHVVAFPSVRIDEGLSADGPREIIWDRNDLKQIERSASRLSSHWSGLTRLDPHQFAELRKALAPTRRVRTLLSQHIDDVVEKLVELTEQQAQILQVLRRQRRVMITGGSGTGKTTLAVERARQLAEDGHRVLLLAFRPQVGDELADQVEDLDNVTAGQFDRVAGQIVADAGMTSEVAKLEPLVPDENWITRPSVPSTTSDRHARLLPDAAAKLDLQFDAVVVDEGQDFRESWWIALELLLRNPETGYLYVFADSHSVLYRPGWAPPFERPPFELDVNCRNTNQIARRVAAVYGSEPSTLGVDGPEPIYNEIRGPDDASKRAHRVIEKLVGDEGFRPDQLSVLSRYPSVLEDLDGLDAAKGVGLSSVEDFVGLESDVVVLVLDEITDGRGRALAYSGMSRARALLMVLGPPATKTAIGWT